MTDVTIREATPADLAGMAALMTAVNPDHPTTASGLRDELDFLRASSVNPHLWQVVAQRAGQVVGLISVSQNPGMFHPDRYHVDVMVHPDARRRGLGGRLAGLADEHLQGRGAREVQTGAFETWADSLRFLAARGFTEHLRYFDNVLNLTGVDFADWEAQMRLPLGVRAVSLAQLQAEWGEEAALRAFFDAFTEARLDVPRSAPATPLSLEDMRRRLDDPHTFPEGLMLAVTEAGEVVALSELEHSDAGAHRMEIGLTGTRRAWRRRGLALALKLHGMRVARERGVLELWTGNASTNVPMLALNERLGFRPRPAWIGFRRGSVE